MLTAVRRLTRPGLTAAIGLALALSGCAAGGAHPNAEPPVADYAGWPPGTAPDSMAPNAFEPSAFWLADGERLALVLFGSSSCPPRGVGLEVLEPAEAGNVVEVYLEQIPAGRACTEDYGPYTTEFDRPDELSPLEPLSVRVGELTLEVAPLPGGEPPLADYAGWPPGTAPDPMLAEAFEPTAMWLDDGEVLAVVLFGSSSCPPRGVGLEVLEPAGAGNLVEVFVEPIPPGRICTADYGPYTTEFDRPEDVSAFEPLTVRAGDLTLTVPAR